MHKLTSILCPPWNMDSRHPRIEVKDSQEKSLDLYTSKHRHFAFQPILNASRKAIGCEALFRSGWENHFDGDSNVATQIMIDNWLLYGFEDLNGSYLTFLNCTRDTLISGLLSLLPPWAVFEILETVEPCEEVLRACRHLKRLGYLISLDDFDSPEKMAGFLELADFIKIDFRKTGLKERASLLKRLKGTRAILIAEKIETEEEFRLAKWEGFHLFQGYYFQEQASFAMTKDRLSETNCLRILEAVSRSGLTANKLSELLDLEPGIACRLLRRANWISAKDHPVNTVSDALKKVGRKEFRRIVILALLAEVKNWNSSSPEILQFVNMASRVGNFSLRGLAN